MPAGSDLQAGASPDLKTGMNRLRSVMPIKRVKAPRLEVIPRRGRNVQRPSVRPTINSMSEKSKLRSAMFPKGTAKSNEYVCAIERNQNGKYNVRVRATFGPPAKGGEGAAENGQGSWT